MGLGCAMGTHPRHTGPVGGPVARYFTLRLVFYSTGQTGRRPVIVGTAGGFFGHRQSCHPYRRVIGHRWTCRRLSSLPGIAVAGVVVRVQYVHSGDGTLVMTQDLQSILYKMSEEGSSLRVG